MTHRSPIRSSAALVDEVSGGEDVSFVPLEHLRGLDDEVAPEVVVAELTGADDHPVLGDVAHLRQQRTHQRETGDLSRLPGRHRLRVVGTGRVTDQEVVVPVRDVRGEVEQDLEDVGGAAQLVGCRRQAHPGKVGIDPTQPFDTGEDRLEAGLGLPVVDAGTVQDQHRSPGPVLDVVERRCTRESPHAGRLVTQPRGRHRVGAQTQQAPRTRGPRRCWSCRWCCGAVEPVLLLPDHLERDPRAPGRLVVGAGHDVRPQPVLADREPRELAACCVPERTFAMSTTFERS